MPSAKFNGKSPAHQATGEPPDLSKLRVWGRPAMVHIRARDRDDVKLGHRSAHGIFVGMSKFDAEKAKFVDSKDVLMNFFWTCADR